ncbi:MAG: DUF1800 domain-containing protein [Angustibacter sp.]
MRLPKDLDIVHLINRTTFGVTPALLAEVKKQGAQNWLAEQLNPGKIADPQGEAVLAQFKQAGFTLEDIRRDNPPSVKDVHYGSSYPPALTKATTAWAIFGKRQLHERITQFWNDHFNVTSRGSGVMRSTRPDLDVNIRRLALGKFSDLLRVVAEHPAMLNYLDGAQNTAKKPNENFAREIMELHTLGVDGGYTEDDVIAAARLLTGWSNGSAMAELGDLRFTSRYIPERHAVGPVKVLNFTSANASAKNGLAEQRKFYSYLAKHPATAKHLSTKLAKVFVADQPSSALVDRLAKVYLDSDTQILPVLCELFSSPEFAGSVGKKVRRPREYVIAALRAMGPEVKPGLEEGLSRLPILNPSHEPFTWATPDGFPITADQWSSPGISLEMFNTVSAYVRFDIPSLGLPDESKLLPQSITTVDAATGELTKKWFGRSPLDAELRAARILADKSGIGGTFSSDIDRTAIGGAIGVLLLQSPSLLSC